MENPSTWLKIILVYSKDPFGIPFFKKILFKLNQFHFLLLLRYAIRKTVLSYDTLNYVDQNVTKIKLSICQTVLHSSSSCARK